MSRDEEVVELVAQAMFKDSVYASIRWETATEALKDEFRKPARAAIAAIATHPQDEMREALEEALELLRRYRHETPLRHQPHMISGAADKLLAKIDAALISS